MKKMKKMKKIKNLKKYIPAILTGASCVGVGITAWFSHINTKKEMELESDSVKDRVVVYLPTIISGTVTIATIIFNHKMSRTHIASVVTAAGISSKLLNEYRQKAIEVLGKETVEDIDKKVAKDHEDGIIYCVSPTITSESLFTLSVDRADDGDILFFEPFKQTWFRTSKEAVRLAWYHLNRNMALGMAATMDQLYDFLGIGHFDDNEMYGWGIDYIEDGMYWIDMELIESETDDGEKYYILEYGFMPELLTEDDV